jgi:hypothetical protein
MFHGNHDNQAVYCNKSGQNKLNWIEWSFSKFTILSSNKLGSSTSNKWHVRKVGELVLAELLVLSWYELPRLHVHTDTHTWADIPQDSHVIGYGLRPGFGSWEGVINFCLRHHCPPNSYPVSIGVTTVILKMEASRTSKRWLQPTRLHGITQYKTTIIIFTTVKTSNLSGCNVAARKGMT